MKKISYILLICVLFDFFTPLINTYALVNYEFKEGSYHVVYVKDDTTATKCDNVSVITYDNSNIEYIKSFDNYDDAFKYSSTLNSTDDKIVSIIGERKTTNGKMENKILYSQYALVDLNTANTTAVTSNVYIDDESNKAYTYINGHGAFGGVDAAFIDYSKLSSRVRIKISGVTGWINTLISSKYNGYEVIPINRVRSGSYYYVSDSGDLIHRLSKKITANNCYSSYINLGPAPSSLKSEDENGNMIKYYSYDGNYFYDSYINMLNDYKNGTTDKAVNIIPYFNYYMYSPARVPTNITAEDIKSFLESRGYTSNDKSKLVGEELSFISAQKNYGVNAIMILSTAINESGWGTSYLAKNKNNLFGHNAVDSDVYNSANGYKSPSDSINYHAYYMVNTLYSETKDYSGIYHGSHLGNKNSGMNVKYASDPYWGEKIAAIYRSVDAFVDYKDYNKYTIGIKTSNVSVPVYNEAKTDSIELYKLTSKAHEVTNMPVYVLGKVKGENINGNDVWYKIQTDALLNEDRTDVIQSSKSDTYYDRDNNYGYVHSSYITMPDENVKQIYTKKDGLFGLYDLSVDENKNVNITGYLAIKDIDNSKNRNITYDLIFENQLTKEKYEKKVERITDKTKIPYEVSSGNKYSYLYSWFNGNLDLSDIKEGNYTIYVRARSGEYESTKVLSNLLLANIASKFTKEERGYQFRVNYYLKTVPVELLIRDKGLISDEITPTTDNMFNQYETIEFKDNKLNISGTSFNVGGDYSKDKDVKRSIIFENVKTFERFEFNLGYIDNGTYEIKLVVPDNKDKTRAWFKNSIDISTLEKGTYAIYIKTESNIKDYGELRDITMREINTTMNIDDKTYSIKLNKNQRFRLELEVK